MIREALAAAAARLSEVSDTPRLDAELLMAHALDMDRETLLLHGGSGAAPAAFPPLVERRLRHEPVAYITGRRGFWTVELEVGPGVLIPRPDSETLILAAIERFGVEGPATILDLGTGPGTLLLAALAEWPQARGTGIDASATALDHAMRNAELLGLAARADFRIGDWRGTGARFDLILCNPPYVEAGAPLAPDVARFEPPEALFAGADGLDAYRAIAPLVPAQLAAGGILCLEIGMTQAEAVTAMLTRQGLRCEIRHDLGGRDRCIVARL